MERRRISFEKNHFKKKSNTELDRQLRGIHEPQQPLQKVIFSLLERRLLAGILGDLDETIPETEIVQRKVYAINGWIDYAWKIELKELVPSQDKTMLQMPLAGITGQIEAPPTIFKFPTHGQTIKPKPRYVSMIQTPISPAAPMRLGTAITHSEINTARTFDAAILDKNRSNSLLAAREPRCAISSCLRPVSDVYHGPSIANQVSILSSNLP